MRKKFEVDSQVIADVTLRIFGDIIQPKNVVQNGKEFTLFPYEMLKAHFNDPLSVAAGQLHCQTEDLKASYKLYGMKRWPCTGSAVRVKRIKNNVANLLE